MTTNFDPSLIDWKEQSFLAELKIDIGRYEYRVKQLKSKRMLVNTQDKPILDYEVACLEEVVKHMTSVRTLMETYPRQKRK